jgi:hypothetical protein
MRGLEIIMSSEMSLFHKDKHFHVFYHVEFRGNKDMKIKGRLTKNVAGEKQEGKLES